MAMRTVTLLVSSPRWGLLWTSQCLHVPPLQPLSLIHIGLLPQYTGSPRAGTSTCPGQVYTST